MRKVGQQPRRHSHTKPTANKRIPTDKYLKPKRSPITLGKECLIEQRLACSKFYFTIHAPCHFASHVEHSWKFCSGCIAPGSRIRDPEATSHCCKKSFSIYVWKEKKILASSLGHIAREYDWHYMSDHTSVSDLYEVVPKFCCNITFKKDTKRLHLMTFIC